MKLQFKQLLVLLFTIGMITVNALANILPFNGVSTAQVSDSLQSYFVPAGYVFSIWGVIYLLLLAFAIGSFFLGNNAKELTTKISFLYLFSCVLNAVWIALWHYGFFITTVVVMITLLLTLIAIYQELGKNPPKSTKELWLIHIPFSVYLAWICVATIANISGVLWLLRWNGFGISDPIWSSLLMWVAGFLATATAYTRRDVAFSMVIVWAIIGILVNFSEQLIMRYAGMTIITVIVLTWALLLITSYKKNINARAKKSA